MMIKNATCSFILNSVYEKYASSKEAFFFVPPVPLLNNNVTLEGKKKYRPNVFSPSVERSRLLLHSQFQVFTFQRTIIFINNSLISKTGSAHNGLE